MHRWIGFWADRKPLSGRWPPGTCKEGRLVLYDITSSYFEGEYSDSELVLFDSDGQGKLRQWTFESVIQRLMAIRRQNVSIAGTQFRQVTTPEPDQHCILNLLGVKL